jgi:hypothetical protein
MQKSLHGEKIIISRTVYNKAAELTKIKELNYTVKQKPSTAAAAVTSGQRATVIVAPTFQDPYASSGTPEYAGYGYYILRLTDPAGGTWEANHDPAYTLNTQVLDSSNNRVYTMINESGIANPALSPHENPTDWELSEEIKVEFASCLYNRTTETGVAIKDCVPVLPAGYSVKITTFKKSDNTTIYLLDETVSYVGTPEERNITMYEDALTAVYANE